MRLTVLALSALVATAGCGVGRDPAFADRTAQVDVDGRITTYEVDGCVLDGQTAYVAGHTAGGATVQAVIGVEADRTTGVPDSTGITVIFPAGDPSVSAFGAEAWARRGRDDARPGTITSARIKGSRIQARGEAAVVDAEERPTGQDGIPVSFDARCDETG